jgi:hypothetical protein
MNDTPARTVEPAGLPLAGSPRVRGDRPAGHGREQGSRLLLLVPVVSLGVAALLIIALSLITASPAPPPGRESFGSDLGLWTGSPVIEEQPGDETTRRPR